MQLLRRSILGFWLFMMSGIVVAQQDPIQMLDEVTTQVLSELKTNRSQLKRNPNKIYDLVNHLIVPHADFSEMARWVVGRNVWQQSDNALQATFIQEFKTLIVRTYATSLLEYVDQQVEFLPMRGSIANKDRVQVSSLIKGGGRKPLRVDYRLLREGNEWRVYDIIIEGVSIVQGYRSQFAEDARRGGLNAVIERIREHNQQRKGSK